MTIKNKVALGVVFLFLVILTIGGVGLYYVRELAQDTSNIIRNNVESLQYVRNVLYALERNTPVTDDSIALNVLHQEKNITEPNELELTLKLKEAFTTYQKAPQDSASIHTLREAALAIQELNLNAIMRKNDIALNTAVRARNYVILIATTFALIAFSFIINFPGYIANPIVQLTASIKSIANKNYEERLHFDRKDEFEELAQAFNLMAEKLDEYEHSNLAKVLFEKRRIETIINQMADPVIGLDENNRVVFANDQALTLLALTRQNLIGQYAPDVAVDNDLFRNLIRRDTDTSRHTNTGNLIKVVLDGKENYFAKEAVTIDYTPTGEQHEITIGQVLFLRNITPFKELDLAKTNFIATISHELKTPIASLQMCTKLLQDTRVGGLNDEQFNITQTMNDEIARLSNITHELLDLAQVESGNIKVNVQSVHPRQIVQYALEAVRFQADQKHITIDTRLQESITNVKADPDKTTWVLVNLLTNTIRYSPTNGTIILSCTRQHDRINFSVQDFGPGIDHKYRDRLFEKFYQVPGTASGSGLGLAISKEFIDAQGGQITVSTEVGKGSQFSFQLLVA